MTDDKHTPGPWYWWLPHGVDGGCRMIRTVKGRAHGGYHGTEFASTYGLSDDDEDRANAELLAQAWTIPELRAALVYARRFLNEEDHDTAFVDAALALAQEKE